MESIRALLAITAIEDLEMIQFDIKTAFLHGDLQEEIYMSQPEGFVKDDKLVCRMRKSLYGLKQASKAWNDKFSRFLKEFQLKQSEIDPCVFYDITKQRKTIVMIYVDDGLACSSSKDHVNEILNHLRKYLEVKKMEPTYFIGLQIERDRQNRKLRLHQKMYIEGVLKRFNMKDCRPVGTPADPSRRLVESKVTSDRGSFPYREAVGSLMYAMVGTRPDIAYAVSILSQYLANPDQSHWLAAKRVMRYLKGTMDMGITFSAKEKPELIGYSDSDYAGDADN